MQAKNNRYVSATCVTGKEVIKLKYTPRKVIYKGDTNETQRSNTSSI